MGGAPDEIPDAVNAAVRAGLSPAPLVFEEEHSLVDALDEMKGLSIDAAPVIARDGSLKGPSASTSPPRTWHI